jgi:hypothetical protein
MSLKSYIYIFFAISLTSITFSKSQVNPSDESDSNLLFNDFMVTNTLPTLQFGNIFPNIRINKGNLKQYLSTGNTTFIMIHGSKCTTCDKIFSVFSKLIVKSNVKVLHFVTWGEEEPSFKYGTIVDLRNTNRGARTSGLFKRSIGLINSPGYYLLNEKREILFEETDTQKMKDSFPQLQKVLEKISSGKSSPSEIGNPQFSRPNRGNSILTLGGTPPFLKESVKNITNSAKVSAFIFTNDSCDQCDNFSNRKLSLFKTQKKLGVAIFIVSIGKRDEFIDQTDFYKIQLAGSDVEKAWYVTQWPHVIFLSGNNYAGRLNYGQFGTSERNATDRPFDLAFEKVVRYLKNK